MFPEDCVRIVKALLDVGYVITPYEAEMLWSTYSDRVDAGWLFLPDTDEEIVAAVRTYLEES